MPRLIAGAAAALIVTMLGTAPAGALDLTGGKLRAGSDGSAGASALDDLAALDIGDPVPNADDQLDAIAAEEAALGIDAEPTFVPMGSLDPDELNARADDAGTASLEAAGTGAAAEPFVEAIPVLVSPDRGFRPVVPRATASVVPLGSWTRSNPRSSTVVLGGSWVAR